MGASRGLSNFPHAPIATPLGANSYLRGVQGPLKEPVGSRGKTPVGGPGGEAPGSSAFLAYLRPKIGLNLEPDFTAGGLVQLAGRIWEFLVLDVMKNLTTRTMKQ